MNDTNYDFAGIAKMAVLESQIDAFREIANDYMEKAGKAQDEQEQKLYWALYEINADMCKALDELRERMIKDGYKR